MSRPSRKRRLLEKHRCYCAFCKNVRSVYRKRHLSLFDGILALAASLLLGFALWQGFDPRLLVIFAISLVITELFIVFRWRLSIACPHCGFDPVLYKKQPEKAAARVREHYQSRRDDPLSVFMPPPKLQPIIKRSASPLVPRDGRPDA